MINILYYFKDYQIPMCQWQHLHIIDELRHHNCEVEIFNPTKFKNVEQANEQVVLICKENRYDLFMNPYNEKEVYIDTIEEIKKMGIPTLLICFDNLLIPFEHQKVAPHYDLVWLTSKETKWIFDKNKVNSIFMPYAANPYVKIQKRDEIKGVGFIGSPYGSRMNIINQMSRNGIDIYVHYDEKKGSGSSRIQRYSMDSIFKYLKFQQGRKVILGALKNRVVNQSTLLDRNSYMHPRIPCDMDDLFTTYRQYALALSSTAARNTGVLKEPLNVVNLRSFEIPMAGGVQFCQYFEELAEYFEDRKEILFYQNQEEMIEISKYYLSDKADKERQRIRIAARKRAIGEHSWWNRFSKIFDELGIKYNGL